MSVLVVAAHPDDEVLGCGGTIARLVDEKQDVFVAILGEGATSRYHQREMADLQLVRDLQACSRNAAKILGIKELFFYEFPDNRFDTVSLLDIVKVVEDLVSSLKPNVVYSQHGGDLNIDHAILYRATLTATRPVPGSSVQEVRAFEVPSSTEWAFNQFSPIFQPNIFVDISQTLDMKIRAMETYKTEARDFPHPRSPQAIQAMAQNRGAVAGMAAAECFQLVWARYP